MTTQQIRLWNEFACKRTIRDYLSFLGYSAVPAMAPLGVVWLVQQLSFRDLISGGSLYLVVIGACGALISKAVMSERLDDREQVHLPIFVVLLLACVGFGLSVALQGDGILAERALTDFQRRNVGLSVGLLLLAIGPIGLNTCRVTSKVMQRSLYDRPARRLSDPDPDGAIDLVRQQATASATAAE